MAEVRDGERLLLEEAEMDAPIVRDYGFGRVAAFSVSSPDKTTPNEDSALVLPIDERRAVLAIADGLGGQPAGEKASSMALGELAGALRAVGDGELREAILDGFDRANHALMTSGLHAMTTLAVAEIEGRTLRTYHVGDTEILLFGSQGKLKLQTLAHSPVAYAVEAGLLDARDALAHEDRHLVNNVLGAEGMRVEMSSRIEMAPRDTLLTASDGLMDNLHVGEIVERLRRGPLDEAVAGLVSDCRHRMETPAKNRPSKADDLTLIAFRPAR